MSKITLQNLTSGFNSTTKINANNAAIATAFDNTLSRDGTSPNTMLSDLDMNSHHILNLPAPSASTDAARWQDVLDAAIGILSGPLVVPSLTTNTAALGTAWSFNDGVRFGSLLYAVDGVWFGVNTSHALNIKTNNVRRIYINGVSGNITLEAPTTANVPTLTFQQTGTNGGASWLSTSTTNTVISILGAQIDGPGIQARWDYSTSNRYLAIGKYDSLGAFTPTLTVQEGDVTIAGNTYAKGVSLVKYKTAQTAVISTNTLANDADLVFTNVPAGTYMVRGRVVFGSVTAGAGFQWKINVTGTLTGNRVKTYTGYVNTAFTNGASPSNLTSSVGFGTVDASGQDYILFEGSFTTTTAGDVAFQWAQNAVTATNTVVDDRSYMELLKLA